MGGDSHDWHEVPFPVLQSALSSGRTTALALGDLPPWTKRMRGLRSAWLYYEGGDLLTSTGSLSSAHAQAHFDLEREDANRLKYYRYFLIQMSDGRVFQSGPIKDVDYGHHREEPPDWTLQYSTQG